MSKLKLKSPIKDKPLRNPGESLDKRIFDVFYDNVLFHSMMSAFAVMIALMEWHHWYFKTPPSPIALSLFALVIVIYSAPKILKGLKELKALKQGRDGEKAVGQYLESLREQGARVFHDIPGGNFNIDHVVICKSGLFAIETKTYSKPEKGEAVVLFDGKKLLYNGLEETDKPLIQAQAASNWLKDLVAQGTGLKFSVQPVLVFPGWFIQATAEAKASPVWVLNPKGLPIFIANSKEQLSEEQVKLAAYHLSRYVRTFVDKK